MVSPPDVFAESAIDVCLVAAPVTRMSLEPDKDVRVDPQCNLLFHGPIEDSPPGV